MEATENLLLHSDLLVKPIAFGLGYPDASTFSKAFHRHTGISPQQLSSEGKHRRKVMKKKAVMFDLDGTLLDILEMLNALKARKAKLAILSNKPNPAGAQASITSTGIPKEAWLYVGDTNTDMQTATTAGIFAVGCTWGFRDRDELFASGANAIINHPSELLMLFDHQPSLPLTIQAPPTHSPLC